MKTGLNINYGSALLLGLYFLTLPISVGCSTEDDAGDLAAGDGFKGELVYTKNFGGSLTETGNSIVALAEGEVAVLGFSESTDGDLTGKARPGNDYWLLHLDGSGEKLLSKTYGGSGDDIGTALIRTIDNGFMLAGYSMSADGDASKNEGFHDNWFVKTDLSGNLEWERSYGFSGHDHAYSVIQTSDGGYFTAGFLDVIASKGAGNETTTRHGVGEFWGQKLNASGGLEWRRYFGGSSNDRAYKVLQAEDGGFILFGLTESDDFDISGTKGSYEFWVLKISSIGDLLWERTYGGSGIEQAFDAVASADGGFVIVGQGFSNDGDASGNHGGSDAWIIKIDADGKLIWQKMLGGSNFDLAQSIAAAADGTFFVAGNSRSADGDLTANAGENDIWVFRLDGNGKLLWQQTFGGSGIDMAQGITVSEEGIVTVTGSSASVDGDFAENKGLTDLWVLQLR